MNSHTITQRVRDNRTVNGVGVTYSEAEGHAWLIGHDPGDPTGVTTADNWDITEDFPFGGGDDKLTAVINLIERSSGEDLGPIKIDRELINRFGYERTCDSSGVLAGARLLIYTTHGRACDEDPTAGLTLADDDVWASDLVDDERGMHGALNALWNTAWRIHYLMSRLKGQA